MSSAWDSGVWGGTNKPSGSGNSLSDSAGVWGTSGAATSVWGGSDSVGSAQPWGGSGNQTPDLAPITEASPTASAASSRRASWLPAWACVLGFLLAAVLAWLAWTAPVPANRIAYGVISYLIGALAVSVLANVQRSIDTSARSRGLPLTRRLGLLAEEVAKIFMWASLAAAIAAVIPVATELAKR